MRQTLIAMSIAAALATMAGCSKEPEQVQAAKPASEQSAAAAAMPGGDVAKSNPLLAKWAGPYGGVPAFDKMSVKDLKSALEFGMAQNLSEIDAIANNPEAPTFANTIEEMERSGKALGQVFTYWGIWSGNMSSPEFRAVQGEMAPKLADFSSKIIQNDKLFQRVKAVYDARNDSGLDAEQKRVVELTYDEFATNGATLSGDAKVRYAAINKRLAELHTKFANNVLADEEGYDMFLRSDQLAGLPESFVKAAAALAEEKGQKGNYAITNTRSSMDPFLTYSENRALREKVWTNYYSRGDNGDEHDNNAIIAEILQLRDERVGLLGFENYAQWRLQNRMAKNPQRAIELMEAVWPAAVARVHEEVADMQAVADAEKAGIKIEPWDYRFYAEKVRKAKYDLNSDEVKQYLQLDNLREGMFYVAGELFNFKFTPVKEGSVPVFHEDVKVWEVTDKTSGEHIGLWYLDPFARAGKRSGAWASMYRDHTTFDGKETVLASNNSNFIKGAPGEPVLVSWDDAETFFHEFGHALHFLASSVTYPTLNGGVRDYTEFQSQLLERWLSTDPIIDNYLVHYKTGEPIPADLVAKIKKAANFNQGFATTEYLASALVDMKLHTTDPKGIDPDKFERETLTKLGMPSELVMRHRTPHFGHIFSGEGYSAGYYGYMWADVLTSDASEAFAEAEGGFYDKEVAGKLVKYLFAPRNAIDPADAYRLFRGRDAGIEPLMRDRGFPVPGEAKEATAAAGN
ncbi:M3 family metallopeptidase [Microbulbifer sp. CAU 1566]|uniref:M3 family metallopeptidase n=1 Tax=Microbulbifer sp. CAU 1566 TaxID=2933269 RepID=UPI0020032C69|nr:M3 family metallopeptidase [Microbulbifer sp. CAU 1566]MCK7597033.1 M3 family metallopeptidase [Microbulbifer sp. CAU 1566]